jgi:hypothetical protein
MEDQAIPEGPAIDLSQFDETFASAPAEDEDVPDGKYQANVEKVEITKSQTSGNPMVKWTLRILGPEHEGRCLWRHNVLLTDENVAWLKKDLKKCGLEIAKISDLPANLERLLDVKLLVTKKTAGEYSNIYFNRRLEGVESVSTPF